MVGGKLALIIGGAGFLILFSIGAWLLSKTVALDVARNKGIKKVSAFLNNPILAVDYAENKDLDVGQVEAMVNQQQLKAYSWGGHLFVENKIL